MDRISKHLESVKQRIFLATILFVVFILAAVVVAINDASGDAAFFAQLIPAGGAFAVLPRDVVPTRWPTAETAEEQDLLDMMRGELRSLYSRTITMRIVFLGVFLIGMLLLPHARF